MPATPASTSPKRLLERYGLRAKKSFGQNFLSDVGVAQRIADLVTGDGRGGSVLEIGAGLGALTGPLLERFDRVVAIERDRDLIPVLGDLFADAIESGALLLMEADAKSVDWIGALAGHPEPFVLTGNLPYQLTGMLMRRATACAGRTKRVVFLVQLEVAERLIAQPKSPEYGALSVFIQAQFQPRRALSIGRGSFYPAPRVDSAIVVLVPRQPPLIEESDAFRQVVRSAFEKRRKKLRNCWRGILGRSDEQVRLAAQRAGIDLEARGETLGVDAFARMTRELSG